MGDQILGTEHPRGEGLAPRRLRKAQRPAETCKAAFCQEFIQTCTITACGQDDSGNPLNNDDRRGLLHWSTDLQLALLALGMISEELETIVRTFIRLTPRPSKAASSCAASGQRLGGHSTRQMLFLTCPRSDPPSMGSSPIKSASSHHPRKVRPRLRSCFRRTPETTRPWRSRPPFPRGPRGWWPPGNPQIPGSARWGAWINRSAMMTSSSTSRMPSDDSRT